MPRVTADSPEQDVSSLEETMQDKDLFEAQFWWAFSCLAVSGRRNEEDFRAQLMRRDAGLYPDAAEANSIIQEACRHLPSVLNRAKTNDATPRRALSGWDRHLLAVSTHQRG
jgi:hypothetical protein